MKEKNLKEWRELVAKWDASLLNMETFAKPLREDCDYIECLKAEIHRLRGKLSHYEAPEVFND